MKDDERALLREKRHFSTGRSILDQEALQVARTIFPEDAELPLMSATYNRDNPDSYIVYGNTASHIRKYPIEEQKRFFLEVWGSNGVNVPNADALAEYLAKCNTIPWFSPVREVRGDLLQSLVNRHIAALQKKEIPIFIIDRDWSLAIDIAGKHSVKTDKEWKQYSEAIKRASEETRDGNIPEGLGDPIWTSVWVVASGPDWSESKGEDEEATFMTKLEGVLFLGADKGIFREDEAESLGVYFGAWKAANEASMGAEYSVIADKMNEYGYPKNPLEPLIDIYRLGYQPLGELELERNGEKQRVFGIFQPPIRV